MNYVVLLAGLADRMGKQWVLNCIDAVLRVKCARLCEAPAHLDPILTEAQASRVVLAAAVADADGRWWDLLTARDALEAGFLTDEDF